MFMNIRTVKRKAQQPAEGLARSSHCCWVSKNLKEGDGEGGLELKSLMFCKSHLVPPHLSNLGILRPGLSTDVHGVVQEFG